MLWEKLGNFDQYFIIECITTKPYFHKKIRNVQNVCKEVIKKGRKSKKRRRNN